MREGCATAPARRRHQPLAEGKAQVGAPSGCALLGQRQPQMRHVYVHVLDAASGLGLCRNVVSVTGTCRDGVWL